MTEIAGKLEKRGFHLRSGGAAHADEAFAVGVKDPRNKSIYVPWANYEGLPSSEVIIAPSLSNWEDALEIGEEAHPAWEKCTSGARKLLSRNAYQILGDDLHTPVEFIIGWTHNGKASGGTGQAYRIANMLPNPPPIYDLGHADVLATFLKGWLPE
jgi:hypothetical protein